MANPKFTRRHMFYLSATLAACSIVAQANPFYDAELSSDGRDPSRFPPPESYVDFPVTEIDLSQIPEEFRRQTVPYYGDDFPGTIIVDPHARHLYHVQDGGFAVRYGVGVGRAGFEWQGQAVVGMKRRWPRWLPPLEMTARDVKAAKWINGQPGGPGNPLGARALYLNADGKDTLYRIHGTTEPHSIGKAMSSGCIRMLNQDVAFLFDMVPVGTKVFVRGKEDADTYVSHTM
jgi:lipoprotein-anchoring transpeptidase ErfK/SrfK